MTSRHAVRLAITYSDGSIEDFDNFMVAVARGLIASGRDDDGTILYTSGESLSTEGMAHIAATPEVNIALLKTVAALIRRGIEGLPPDQLPDFLTTLLSMTSEETEICNVNRSIERRQG